MGKKLDTMEKIWEWLQSYTNGPSYSGLDLIKKHKLEWQGKNRIIALLPEIPNTLFCQIDHDKIHLSIMNGILNISAY